MAFTAPRAKAAAAPTTVAPLAWTEAAQSAWGSSGEWSADDSWQTGTGAQTSHPSSQGDAWAGGNASWQSASATASPPSRPPTIKPLQTASWQAPPAASSGTSWQGTGDSWQAAADPWGSATTTAWSSASRGSGPPGPLTVLFVAEKPAIARAIASALGKGSGKGSGKGYTQEESSGGASVPVYCLDAPWTCKSPPSLAQAGTVKLRITSTVGHVYCCEFPQRMRSWKLDPEKLFDALVERIEPDNGKSKMPAHLAGEAAKCHAVALWLDCDREGENICYEVLQNVLPNLWPHPRLPAAPQLLDPQEDNFHKDPRVWRAHFSSLAPTDLAKAFANLRKPNPWDSRCVEARQEIDLKVGVALTRLITSNLRDHVSDLCPAREDGKSPMISYGPCQTPTLSFCVGRWDLIQRFNKETSFTITASVRPAGVGDPITLQWVPPHESSSNDQSAKGNAGDGKGKKGGWNGGWESSTWPADDTASDEASGDGKGKKGGAKGKKSGPVYTKEQLERQIAQIKQWEQHAVVTSCECEEMSVPRPTALNTVAMLKAASRELGMDPHHAMQVGEKLYTSGMMTYPRTETTRYPPAMDLYQMVKDHSNHPKWGTWCQGLMRGDQQEPLPGVDNGDHPPITPVWCVPEDRLQRTAGADGVKLYELIVRYFLASVSPDVYYRHYNVHFSIGSINFVLKGNDVYYKGYSTICRGASMHDPALHAQNLLKGSALAAAKNAQTGGKHQLSKPLEVTQVTSSPPELLTEADLLGLMEKHGIGTDASMAQHIHNVVTRGYVEILDPGRRIRPTVLGVALVHGLRQVDSELIKPAVRARIEKDVTDISKRRRQFSEVVASALATFREKFHNVKNGMPKMLEEFEWKRKKWRQWKDSDTEFAKRGGGATSSDSKGGAKGGSSDGKGYGKGEGNKGKEDKGKGDGKVTWHGDGCKGKDHGKGKEHADSSSAGGKGNNGGANSTSWTPTKGDDGKGKTWGKGDASTSGSFAQQSWSAGPKGAKGGVASDTRIGGAAANGHAKGTGSIIPARARSRSPWRAGASSGSTSAATDPQTVGPRKLLQPKLTSQSVAPPSWGTTSAAAQSLVKLKQTMQARAAAGQSADGTSARSRSPRRAAQSWAGGQDEQLQPNAVDLSWDQW